MASTFPSLSYFFFLSFTFILDVKSAHAQQFFTSPSSQHPFCITPVFRKSSSPLPCLSLWWLKLLTAVRPTGASGWQNQPIQGSSRPAKILYRHPYLECSTDLRNGKTPFWGYWWVGCRYFYVWWQKPRWSPVHFFSNSRPFRQMSCKTHPPRAFFQHSGHHWTGLHSY